MAGPALALAVSRAGGLGFIGSRDETTTTDLSETADLLSQTPFSHPTRGSTLPIGLGYIVWLADLSMASAAWAEHKPAAVWLFAPARGQEQLDEWARKIREVSPESQVWVQVGTLAEAVACATSPDAPDVLVIQGTEAGGHGRAKDGIGLTVLLPEVSDALQALGGTAARIPLLGAGGIADGRGVAAALALGASGVVMGTRFLASPETRVAKGYQDEVVRSADGAESTVRTLLYNHLRGVFGWPAPWAPRMLKNLSWEEEQRGVAFEELQRKHDEALKDGHKAWGREEGRAGTYAGAGVGLVNGVKWAGEVVEEVRGEAKRILVELTAGDA